MKIGTIITIVVGLMLIILTLYAISIDMDSAENEEMRNRDIRLNYIQQINQNMSGGERLAIAREVCINGFADEKYVIKEWTKWGDREDSIDWCVYNLIMMS